MLRKTVSFYQVRAILGPQSYLLSEYEELWSKDLSTEVEKLLRSLQMNEYQLPYEY